ncbi:leucine-rich repeat domain-containing protein [bacterium]|nr:leucine-rich repeat domain-containing protein [bacterium]
MEKLVRLMFLQNNMSKLFITIFLFHTVLSAQEKLLDSTALSSQKTYTSMADALQKSQNVYKLSLQYQHIESIPAQLTQFKNLQVLDLSNNGISEVSDVIGHFPNLQVLDLSFQMNPSQPNYQDVVPLPCLNKLSLAIGKLSHLTHLYLHGHAFPSADLLQIVSKDIAKLKNLEVLDLRADFSDGLGNEALSRFQAFRIQRMLTARVLFDSSVYNNIHMKPMVKMWVDSVTAHDSAEVIREILKQDKGVEQSYTRLLKTNPEMKPSIVLEFTTLNGARSALKVISEVYDGFSGEIRHYEPDQSLMPFVRNMQANAFKRLPAVDSSVFIRLRYELTAVEE